MIIEAICSRIVVFRSCSWDIDSLFLVVLVCSLDSSSHCYALSPFSSITHLFYLSHFQAHSSLLFIFSILAHIPSYSPQATLFCPIGLCFKLIFHPLRRLDVFRIGNFCLWFRHFLLSSEWAYVSATLSAIIWYWVILKDFKVVHPKCPTTPDLCLSPLTSPSAVSSVLYS